MQTAVFLDRDNTLIHNDGDLGRAEDVRLVDGVPTGLKSLRDAGYNLIVVTNQAGVARGVFAEADVDAVHQRIAALVDEEAHANGLIDRFYYCPYHPEGKVPEYRRDHLWRKPHPGMILQAARDVGIDLARSWMIGDQERDVQAGRSAGCRTVLVTRDAELARRAAPTVVAKTFDEAVRIILDLDRATSSTDSKTTGNGTPASGSQAMPRQPTPTDEPSSSRDSGDAKTKSIAAVEGPSGGADASAAESALNALRRSVAELADEVRSDRMRRADFSIVRMAAGLCQLLAVLLAIMGLMNLTNADAFLKWMAGAGLAQMLTITLLVLSAKS